MDIRNEVLLEGPVVEIVPSSETTKVLTSFGNGESIENRDGRFSLHQLPNGSKALHLERQVKWMGVDRFDMELETVARTVSARGRIAVHLHICSKFTAKINRESIVGTLS